MKLLVTGSGGFLGSYLVRALRERGHEVRGFGRSAQPENEALGIEVIRGDLADAEAVSRAVAGCEAVFHVAARAGVWGDRQSYWETNVLGTRHVLEACRRHAVKSLIYTSTPSVVFTGEAFEGADESLPYGSNWLCHYPESKAVAEAEVLAAHDPEGLRVCALRPHLIWGPGDPHIVPRIVARARQKRLRVIGEGKNRVDITHVRNATHAHLLALDALLAGRAGGKAYFIADAEPVLLWPWINELLKRLGEPQVTRHVSLRAALAAGGFLEKVWSWLRLSGEPPMTRFVAIELAKSHWFSHEAARRDLGYQPVVDNETGLRELVSHEGAGAQRES